MNKNQTKIPPLQQGWKGLTLAEYVELRNGVPLGDSQSLKNMLYRSLGAGSFGGFWQYWNPIWGFGLGKFVYSPLRTIFPSVIALILTFVVSGAAHDLVTMALRRSVTFLFTPWFFLLSLGLVFGRVVNMDISHHHWWIRATVNLAYLIIGLLLTILLKNALAIP